MTTYSYVAVEPSGKKKSGYVDAATQEAAMAAITAEGRYVLEIKAQASNRQVQKSGETKRKGRVSKADLALFTRRLADLSGAGLPLDRVLQVIAEQSESAVLADVSMAVLQEVRGGMPVSLALGMHPKLFPDVFSQTLRAGEASGQFSEVASRLADFQEKEVTRRSQIVSALVYPAVLSLTAVFVVVFLLTFVVPRLSGIFEDLADDLPMSTKILLSSTAVITEYWFIIVAAIVGGFLLFRAWAATDAGAYSKDRMLITMPVVGPVIRKATVSRFARVLGTLVFGGVPILEALHLSGLAAGNRVFKVSADTVMDEVREGRSIAEAMRDVGSFPPVLTHMVAIGEETGDLPKMLGRVSDSMDFEVDNGLRRLTSLVEPAIVLGMGGFVGFVVLSVLLPIFQAQSLVR